MNQEQYEWIRNQVLRFHKNKELILKNTYYGTNEKNLDALASKLKKPWKKQLTLSFTRNDIRFMLKIVDPALVILQAKTIPEYEKRLAEDKIKYYPYLTRAKDTVTMLTELKEILENSL